MYCSVSCCAAAVCVVVWCCPCATTKVPPTAAAATVAATGTGTGTRHVQIPTYLFEADMKQDAAHPARLPAWTDRTRLGERRKSHFPCGGHMQRSAEKTD